MATGIQSIRSDKADRNTEFESVLQSPDYPGLLVTLPICQPADTIGQLADTIGQLADTIGHLADTT